MRPRSHPRTAVALVAGLALAACGGSPTARPGQRGAAAPAGDPKTVETYSRINGMSGQARTDELVKCAEEEGALSIYTSNTDIDDLVDEFERPLRRRGQRLPRQLRVGPAARAAGAEGQLLRQRRHRDQRARAQRLAAGGPAVAVRGRAARRPSARRARPRAGPRPASTPSSSAGTPTRQAGPGAQDASRSSPTRSGRARSRMEVGDVDWFTALHELLRAARAGATPRRPTCSSRSPPTRRSPRATRSRASCCPPASSRVAVSSYSHTIDKAADKGAPVAWKPGLRRSRCSRSSCAPTASAS